MERGSYVRGECLCLSANSRRFTDGASFLYDGTLLVGQSITRVRTPSHTHKSSTLLLMMLHTGDTDPVRVYQLSSWPSRLPSRT